MGTAIPIRAQAQRAKLSQRMDRGEERRCGGNVCERVRCGSGGVKERGRDESRDERERERGGGGGDL